MSAADRRAIAAGSTRYFELLDEAFGTSRAEPGQTSFWRPNRHDAFLESLDDFYKSWKRPDFSEIGSAGLLVGPSGRGPEHAFEETVNFQVLQFDVAVLTDVIGGRLNRPGAELDGASRAAMNHYIDTKLWLRPHIEAGAAAIVPHHARWPDGTIPAAVADETNVETWAREGKAAAQCMGAQFLSCNLDVSAAYARFSDNADLDALRCVLQKVRPEAVPHVAQASPKEVLALRDDFPRLGSEIRRLAEQKYEEIRDLRTAEKRAEGAIQRASSELESYVVETRSWAKKQASSLKRGTVQRWLVGGCTGISVGAGLASFGAAPVLSGVTGIGAAVALSLSAGVPEVVKPNVPDWAWHFDPFTDGLKAG